MSEESVAAVLAAVCASVLTAILTHFFVNRQARSSDVAEARKALCDKTERIASRLEEEVEGMERRDFNRGNVSKHNRQVFSDALSSLQGARSLYWIFFHRRTLKASGRVISLLATERSDGRVDVGSLSIAAYDLRQAVAVEVGRRFPFVSGRLAWLAIDDSRYRLALRWEISRTEYEYRGVMRVWVTLFSKLDADWDAGREEFQPALRLGSDFLPRRNAGQDHAS